jgi:transposase
MNKRIATLQKLIRGALTVSQAAIILKLSTRQIIRLKNKFRKSGTDGLVHGLNGRASNNPSNKDIYTSAVKIVKEKYPDFGPTLATEHLLIDYNMVVNRETLRKRMIQEKIWKSKKRRKQQFRYKRTPKFSYGEMTQYDGSYEPWLECRGNTGEMCMLMAVDDASSKIQLILFTNDEGTKCTFEFWERYILKHGKPLNIYLDKFSTYKSPLVEQAMDPNAKTQFGRAMKTLGIELIYANSPQAKGRVERRFGNLQDRLIKEMRLNGISSIDEANRYANEIFIPWFNKRYGKPAKTTQDLHQGLTLFERNNLKSILSVHTPRVVQNDFTVRYEGKYLQLIESKYTGIFRKDVVIVEDWVDGSVKVRLDNHYLDYIVLEEQPKQEKQLPKKLLLPRKWGKPNQNHPYKRGSYQRYLSLLESKNVTL